MNVQLTDNVTDRLHHIGTMLVAWLDLHAVNILVILIAAWLARRFGVKILTRILSKTIRSDLYPTKSDREKRVKTLDGLGRAILMVVINILAGILIIGEINPSYTTALFASAGLVTVALGFGAKDLINDFVRGIFIITENQYRVGDVVEISGVSGTVENVTIRTTVLRDIDGNVHHVPNGSIIVTTNKTIGYSNLNEQLVLAPDTDLARAEHIINHVGEELAADPEFTNKIKKAPHLAAFNGYGMGGVIIRVAGKTGPNDKYTVKTELYRRLTTTLAKNHINIISSPMAPPLSEKKKK